MNTCHPKMKFTFKKEQNNCFNFFDVKVIREDNVFTTSVYRKPSFSGVYTHFDSCMPMNYKFSLVSTIIFHSFTICSDMPNSIKKFVLHKTFKQLLPACDLRVLFKVSLRMKNYFNFKDKIK